MTGADLRRQRAHESNRALGLLAAIVLGMAVWAALVALAVALAACWAT